MSEEIQEAIALIKRMQEQLTFLERKVDTLLKQAEEKASSGGEKSYQDRPFRDKRYAKPFRAYPPSHGNREYQGGNKNFEGNRADRRDENFRPGAGGQEKSFEHGGHRSEKRYGRSDNRGFGSKKKPFFAKRRERV